MIKIPTEFLLLGKILWAFRERQKDGWTFCTRSEITRRFLYARRKAPLTPQEFYHRVLPCWIVRGVAREKPRPGKPPGYLFRSMSLEEINARLNEINIVHLKLSVAYENPRYPEYQRPDVANTINRLRQEARALKMDRIARQDEILSGPISTRIQ